MRHLRTIKVIQDAGLDPDLIYIHNLDTTGYDEMVLNAHGKPVIDWDSGYTKKARREWPSLAVGIAVIDAFLQDKREMGEIG